MSPAHAPSDAATANGERAAGTGLPASAAPNELHVQVDAPFVFHATGPPPAPVEEVGALPLESRPGAALAWDAPLPPPGDEAQKPIGTETASARPGLARGFFRRIGGFFAALFR